MARHRTHSIEFKRRVVEEYLGGEPLHGLGKRHETEGEMFDAADLVVGATVVNGSSFNRTVGRADRMLPVSRVVLRVSDWIKGDSRPVIVLEQTRGLGLELVDDPGYVSGDDYLLYLREIDTNTYRTVNPDGRILQ